MVDFLKPPANFFCPNAVRIGFRRGHNLGGSLPVGSRVHLRVRSASNTLSPPKVMNRCNPIWGDWAAMLPLVATDPVIR